MRWIAAHWRPVVVISVVSCVACLWVVLPSHTQPYAILEGAGTHSRIALCSVPLQSSPSSSEVPNVTPIFCGARNAQLNERAWDAVTQIVYAPTSIDIHSTGVLPTADIPTAPSTFSQLCSAAKNSDGSIQNTRAQIRLFRQIWTVYAAYYAWSTTVFPSRAFVADGCYRA